VPTETDGQEVRETREWVDGITLLPLGRLNGCLVRRNSLTSALLILVLVTSASACVAGSCQPTLSCAGAGGRRNCPSKKMGTATARESACGRIVQSTPGQCSLRSLVQLQFPAFHKFEISAPFRLAAHVSAPLDTVIAVSSVGSPETDRGPPRS